jgi:hypothetical protein
MKSTSKFLFPNKKKINPRDYLNVLISAIYFLSYFLLSLLLTLIFFLSKQSFTDKQINKTGEP